MPSEAIYVCEGTQETVVEHVAIGPSGCMTASLGAAEPPRVLPVSFTDSEACVSVLRLAGQANISIRLVSSTCTHPFAPLFIRVYTHQANIVSEVRQWGTLMSANLWSRVLAQPDRGMFRESKLVPELKIVSGSKALCEHLQRLESSALECDGTISLARELGSMHFGSFEEAATLMHAEPRAPLPRKFGGILRIPFLSSSALDTVAAAEVQSEVRRGDTIVGQMRKRTQCALMLAPPYLVAGMQPQNGVLLLHNLQEARATSFQALQSNRLVVLAFSVEMLTDMRTWECDTVQVFAQSSARAGGAHPALALEFKLEDKARFFAARCPGQNWVIPFSLLQWSRLFVVLKAIEAEDACRFCADSRWTLMEDRAATLRPPSLYAAQCAAAALGLPEPSAHHPRVYAALVESSVSLCPPLTAPPTFACVRIECCEQEDAVRRALNSLGDRSLAPEVGFRISLGMHPSPLTFEKMVAAVHGMTPARLEQLMGLFAKCAATEYAKERLQMIQGGKHEDCCVCMSETANTMTFCGHMYCTGCMQELWAGVQLDASVKCCVCRAHNYYDDWWRMVSHEQTFREPAVLRALQNLRADCLVNQPHAPLVVALPALSEATALLTRLCYSYGPSSALLVSSLDERGANAAMLSALESSAQFVLCPLTDLSAAALVSKGIRTVALIGTSLPCQITEFGGGAQAYSYKPWMHAAAELVYAWAPLTIAGVRMVILCEDAQRKGTQLAEKLGELFEHSECEPTRLPRKYDLRSGKNRSRASSGSLF